MKNLLWKISAIIVLIFAMFGCNTQNINGPQKNPMQNSGKITLLQDVVDNAEVGSVIDLKDYNDLGSYKATINKTLTIVNGDNLNNDMLTIAADGVKLSGLSSVKVQTTPAIRNGSLKISNSSLSALTIGGVEGRSTETNEQSIQASLSGTTVESMTVSGAGSEITIEDKSTTFGSINANVDCTVLLAKDQEISRADSTNDASDYILKRPTVAEGVSLTFVDMNKGMTLQMITISQLPKTVYLYDETLDLSGLRILGTYTCDSVTVYTKDDFINGIDTVSKFENKYEINAKSGDILKESKTVTVTVGSQSVSFDVYVAPENASVEMTDFEIVLDETFQQRYTADVGQRLSLKGLTVNGKFTVGNEEKIIPVTYTSSPAAGAKVTKQFSTVAVTVENITKYIQLSIIDPLTITFYPNGVDGDPYTQNVIADETIDLDPCRYNPQNLTFDGWNTDSNGKGTAYDQSGDTKIKIKISEDLKLYAQWTDKYWVVSYIQNAEDVSGTMTKVNVLKTDETFKLKDNTFSKVGYTFLGWNTESDGSGISYADDETVDITSWSHNVDLYAQWQINRVKINIKVTVYKDGASTEIYNRDLSGDYGDEIVLPDFDDLSADLAQYLYRNNPAVFSNLQWWLIGQIYPQTTFPPEDTDYDLRMYADNTPEVLNIGIQYNMNGGTLSASGFNIAHELPFRLPTGAYKFGYDFAGWYDNEDLSGDPVTEVPVGIPDRTTVNYWAKWILHPYTIKYKYYCEGVGTGDLTGDEIAGLRTSFSVEDNTFDIGSATKAGYVLTGWWTDMTCSGTQITQIVKGTTPSSFSDEEAKVYKLYAKMEKAKYRLTFDDSYTNDSYTEPSYYDIDGKLYDANKDPLTQVQFCYGYTGGSITLKNYNTYFDFNGYYLEPSCSGAKITDTTKESAQGGLRGLSGDLTIYYGWKFKTTDDSFNPKVTTVGDGEVNINFNKKTSSDDIISITWNSGNNSTTTTDGSIKVSGLTNDVEYTFTMTLTHKFSNQYSITSEPKTVQGTPTAQTNHLVKGDAISINDDSYLLYVMIGNDDPQTINVVVSSNQTGINTENVGVFTNNRSVTLNAYAIGQTEVTQNLYYKVMNGFPSGLVMNQAGQGEEQRLRPADGVSWYEAIAFCNALTKREMSQSDCVYYSDKNYTNPYVDYATNADSVYIDLSKTGYRLPTEAEWEYAARGAEVGGEFWNNTFASDCGEAGDSNGRYYPEGDFNVLYSAWCSFSNLSEGITHQVMIAYEDDPFGLTIDKDANAILYDMSGNVAEWCNDTYVEIEDDFEWQGDGACTNPLKYDDTTGNGKGSAGTDNKVLRGGGCLQSELYVTVYYRFSAAPSATESEDPDEEKVYTGFRLAKSIR